MKISDVLCYTVDGGFRSWIFVKIETDTGLYGWGDASDWDAPETIRQAVLYLRPHLIGQDPMNIEKIWWQNTKVYRRMWGGIAWKAMSGIDSALWDLKGKALNVPVYQLFGGCLRDKIRLYWTHCGTARHQYSDLLGQSSLQSLDDLKRFCQVVGESEVTALKTNIMALRDTPLAQKEKKEEISCGLIDGVHLDTIELIVQTFRQQLGKGMDIAVDTAFEYRGRGALDLARRLEPYQLMWLETETFDVGAQKALAAATTTPIVHGESLYDFRDYLPFLQEHAQAGLMIDLSWNGLTMGRKIADLALAHDCTISPHNCHSPLTSFIAAHFCAATANASILELDVDDVPWRDKIISRPLPLAGGFWQLSDEPGWGVDLIEAKLSQHPARK